MYHRFHLEKNIIPLTFEITTPAAPPRTKQPAFPLSSTAQILSLGSHVQREEPLPTSFSTLSESLQPFFSSVPPQTTAYLDPQSKSTTEPDFLMPPFLNLLEDNSMPPVAEGKKNILSPLENSLVARINSGSISKQKTNFTPRSSQPEPLEAAPQKKPGPLKRKIKESSEPDTAKKTRQQSSTDSEEREKKRIREKNRIREKRRRDGLTELLKEVRLFLFLEENVPAKPKLTTYETVLTLFKQARRNSKELAHLKEVAAQEQSALLKQAQDRLESHTPLGSINQTSASSPSFAQPPALQRESFPHLVSEIPLNRTQAPQQLEPVPEQELEQDLSKSSFGY